MISHGEHRPVTTLTSQRTQTPVKKLKLFSTVFIMSLPQKDTCDQKHAICPHSSHLVK